MLGYFSTFTELPDLFFTLTLNQLFGKFKKIKADFNFHSANFFAETLTKLSFSHVFGVKSKICPNRNEKCLIHKRIYFRFVQSHGMDSLVSLFLNKEK